MSDKKQSRRQFFRASTGLTAAAVAAPGCAQNRIVGRPCQVGREELACSDHDSPADPSDLRRSAYVSSQSSDHEFAVDNARPDQASNSASSDNMLNQEAELEAAELQLAELPIVRGAEPEAAPGTELPAGSGAGHRRAALTALAMFPAEGGQ